jgi:hypothetical protein
MQTMVLCCGWTWPGSNRPPPRCRRGALPALSYRPRPPLEGRVCSCPMGQASRCPKRPCWPSLLPLLAIVSISHRAAERALTGPSRSSRTDPVLLSGIPPGSSIYEWSSQAGPASHRCVLGLNQRRWRCGSSVATPTRPVSLDYSVAVKERSTWTVLGGGRGERSLQSLAGPGLLGDRCLEPLGYSTWIGYALGRITHGIRRDRERRFWLQTDARDAPTGLCLLDRQTPRSEAEPHRCASPTAIAMQLG